MMRNLYSVVSSSEKRNHSTRIDHYEMKTLPLAGAELVRLCFWGNGKDSEARIEVRGAREAIIPLSGAVMDLTFAGPITMSTRGHGDTEVVIEITAAGVVLPKAHIAQCRRSRVPRLTARQRA
jgi:hypothetical protein